MELRAVEEFDLLADSVPAHVFAPEAAPPQRRVGFAKSDHALEEAQDVWPLAPLCLMTGEAAPQACSPSRGRRRLVSALDIAWESFGIERAGTCALVGVIRFGHALFTWGHDGPLTKERRLRLLYVQ